MSLEKYCKCIPFFVNYLRGLKLCFLKICTECFYSVFKEEFQNVIVDNKLLKPGECVGIAAFGRKSENLISKYECVDLISGIFPRICFKFAENPHAVINLKWDTANHLTIPHFFRTKMSLNFTNLHNLVRIRKINSFFLTHQPKFAHSTLPTLFILPFPVFPIFLCLMTSPLHRPVFRLHLKLLSSSHFRMPTTFFFSFLDPFPSFA